MIGACKWSDDTFEPQASHPTIKTRQFAHTGVLERPRRPLVYAQKWLDPRRRTCVGGVNRRGHYSRSQPTGRGYQGERVGIALGLEAPSPPPKADARCPLQTFI